MKRGKSKNGQCGKVWKLSVSAAGEVKLPRELLERVQCWPGDAFAAIVASDAGGGAILLRVLPHGLTRAEIRRAARLGRKSMKRAWGELQREMPREGPPAKTDLARIVIEDRE